MELISGDGEFNEAGFNDFLNSVNLHQRSVSYAVVAIMGPQSSGKSTLMNHLFHTNFIEMDAESGRGQTTKGIWLGKAQHIEPLTLVLDLEGTDGKERGEDDTTFEKQSALFALAVADVVLVNMWCHDIGLERAANRPLLKTIFEIMMRLFSPRKRTLHIVIRDKTTKTPFERLESKLREDVEKIWETVQDHQGLEETPLSEIFNVEITALSHYEFKRDMFEEEVAQLRRNFFTTISPRCCGERQQQDVQLPTSKLSFSRADKIWDSVKDYKGHELSPFRIMVATVGCEEIAMEKLRLFESNQDWLALQQAAETGLVSGFSEKISSILSRYLSEYDYESIQFEKDVRKAKRQYLISEALKLVHPAYLKTLGHLRSEALQSFGPRLEALLSKGERFAESVRTCHQSCVFMFNRQFSDHAAIKQANWDASTVRQELLSDLESHALLVHTKKLSQTENQQRERLTTKLAIQLVNILNDHDDDDKWASIRSLLKSESDAIESALRSAVDTFELDEATVGQLVDDLKQHARNMVETNFKGETRDVMLLMKKRFIIAYREMGSKSKAKKKVYRECFKLLSTVAVIRLDARYDNVESLLHAALMGADSGLEIPTDPLTSITWEEVPPEMTLITPVKCRDIWNQFKLDMELQLANAKYVEKQCKKVEKHLSFGFWAILGLTILGVSAFAILLRVTNIDVAVALTAATASGITMVIDGIYLYRDTKEHIEKNVKDTTEFRKRHSNIMQNLGRNLEALYDFITDAIAQRSSATVGA